MGAVHTPGRDRISRKGQAGGSFQPAKNTEMPSAQSVSSSARRTHGLRKASGARRQVRHGTGDRVRILDLDVRTCHVGLVPAQSTAAYTAGGAAGCALAWPLCGAGTHKGKQKGAGRRSPLAWRRTGLQYSHRTMLKEDGIRPVLGGWAARTGVFTG